jgi:acyl carrier protein
MDPISERLVTCFKTVFPGLPPAEIPAATHASVALWDSVASITLANVIEDEFRIEVDLDLLPELDSFDRIREYLDGLLRTP